MQTDALIGRQISTYTIEEKIGQGGMASVYRAHQPSVNRSIALKIISLDPSHGRREEFRQRFAQEARVIASLEHIHILPIYDYGIVNDEIAYIAMRLLRGGTLGDLMAAGALEMGRAADLLIQIGRGLSYAHSKGVLHRDLKPSNILLDDAGNAFLSDFGLAKLTENAVNITRTDTIVGTPAYMSPEQLRGVALDYRSDIYSLGVLIYHMLAGEQPFQASDSNVVSVIYQHLEKMPDPPSKHNAALSTEIDNVLLRALAKNPVDRYDTALDLVTALTGAMGRTISSSSYPAVRIGSGTANAVKSVPLPSDPTTTASYPFPPQSPTLENEANKSARPSLPLLIGGIVAALIFAGIVLFATGILNRAPNAPIRAVVLEEETGRAVDLVPTDADIRAAQARIGADGFVAYAACVQSSQYHAAQAREIAEFAQGYGLPFRVYNAENDAYTQVTQIEQARADGVRGLIVCPLDITLLDETLSSAQTAGLPLVFMTGKIENYGGVLISGEGTDYEMGLAAGRALGEILLAERDGQGRVAILDYPAMPIIVERANGLEEGVKALAPEVEIVGRFLGGTQEDGEKSIAGLIDDAISFDAILSINDAGSYGAIAALEAAEIAPDAVIISSVDAEPQARQHITNNYYMRASVAVGREKFSRAAVDALVMLMAGGTLPKNVVAPPGETVTRDNLDAGE